MGFREPHMSGDSGIATTTLGDTRLSIRQDIRDVFTRIQVTTSCSPLVLYMFKSGFCFRKFAPTTRSSICMYM
jgi:D-serine deaminase-like pyridoxal phosphate-dependent protein